MEFPCTITDQMGHHIHLAHLPKRIISLVPSQTELLADLGLDEEVVGITKFCVHPDNWFRTKTRVGGTKQYDFEKIASLKPDLIIGNKEENNEEQIRELQEKYPVWMSDIRNLEEALQMISDIGAIVNKEETARTIAANIRGQFNRLDFSKQPSRRVAYLIWRNPYMGAGPGTFIDCMLQKLNLVNILTNTRYPETTLAELAGAQPDFIFLSSEPYPFGEKHIDEIQTAVPSAKIRLVDGEMFSWYGSRLRLAPDYFQGLMASIAKPANGD